MPNWLDFDQIAEWVSGSSWSYFVIFIVAVIDAFFPLVPSETVLVIGGSFAASGDLNLLFVILAGCGRRDPGRQHLVRDRNARRRKDSKALVPE